MIVSWYENEDFRIWRSKMFPNCSLEASGWPLGASGRPLGAKVWFLRDFRLHFGSRFGASGDHFGRLGVLLMPFWSLGAPKAIRDLLF